jgi:hypothetical protein
VPFTASAFLVFVFILLSSAFFISYRMRPRPLRLLRQEGCHNHDGTEGFPLAALISSAKWSASRIHHSTHWASARPMLSARLARALTRTPISVAAVQYIYIYGDLFRGAMMNNLVHLF